MSKKINGLQGFVGSLPADAVVRAILAKDEPEDRNKVLLGAAINQALDNLERVVKKLTDADEKVVQQAKIDAGVLLGNVRNHFLDLERMNPPVTGNKLVTVILDENVGFEFKVKGDKELSKIKKELIG